VTPEPGADHDLLILEVSRLYTKTQSLRTHGQWERHD